MKALITISLHVISAIPPEEKSSLVWKNVQHLLRDTMISHTSKKWLSIGITHSYSA